MTELRTERLLLRRWCEADREPLFQINSDPRVMEFFPSLLSREESDAAIGRYQKHFEEKGFGLFAVETRDVPIIGYIGLATVTFSGPFAACVEIGWRLAADQWGRGFATEGAKEVARHAFQDLHLDSLVSFTSVNNMRSRRVMEKLGMTHDSTDDFDHPCLPASHPLRRHVLYRLHRW